MMHEADQQVVTLGLANEMFAIPVGVVREILEWRAIFSLPRGPDYLLGLTDVRGQSVPVIDLRVRLGMPPRTPDPSTRIIVVDMPIGGRLLTLGLMVDAVREVAAFTPSHVDGVPDIGRRWNSDYMRGVARTEGGFVVLLDIGGLFNDTDAGELAA